jgi:hypothetical protein
VRERTKAVPMPEICPHCGGTGFTAIRLAVSVGDFGARSRPAFRCQNRECALRFDGMEWTYPDGTVYEMPESGT